MRWLIINTTLVANVRAVQFYRRVGYVNYMVRSPGLALNSICKASLSTRLLQILCARMATMTMRGTVITKSFLSNCEYFGDQGIDYAIRYMS